MDQTLERIRRPAYTGKNRCWPCTILNVALLGLCAVVVALVSPLTAAIVLLLGLAVIALRGYLVPYTPRFGPYIADALPGTLFEKPGPDQRSGSMTSYSTENVGEQVFLTLIEHDIIDERDEEIGLTPRFHNRWTATIETLRDGSLEAFEQAITEAIGEADVEIVDGRGGIFVTIAGPSGTIHLSQHVALAETAALLTLEELVPSMEREHRLAAIDPLTMFLESCPVCQEPLVETEPTACCSSARDPRNQPDAIIACLECNRTLYEFEAIE